MRIVVDTTARQLEIQNEAGQPVQTLPLYSPRAFEALSDLWLKVGWDQKYSYSFTWLGRPIIQLPEDAFRIQEVIFKLQPDVIIETGVANGGSLIFYATLCHALGKGKVIGLDIEIRPHNRQAIESHCLASYITLLEGSSTAPEIVEAVHQMVSANNTVLVILDSNHSRQHVLDELNAYHRLVSVGSYIVATDGIMQDLADIDRAQPDWSHNNPVTAAREFSAQHPNFVIEQPTWLFNESPLSKNITYWPSAYLRRVS